MTTQISTKLAALGIALTINLALIGGVAFLFDGELHGHQSMLALRQAAAQVVTVV